MVDCHLKAEGAWLGIWQHTLPFSSSPQLSSKIQATFTNKSCHSSFNTGYSVCSYKFHFLNHSILYMVVFMV